MATNVNAQTVTNTATVKAQATIERAQSVSCSPLNFGNIILKKGAEAVVEILDGRLGQNEALSVTDYAAGMCVDEQDE